MRKIPSCLIGILLITSSLAIAFNIQSVEGSEPPEIEWVKQYGGSNEESEPRAIQTNDGGYALAGGTKSLGSGKFDFWLVKTDASGEAQWNNTYGGPETETAVSLIQTSDKGYALLGNTYSFGAGLRDFWLVKTDEYGDMEWNQTYGGTNFEAGCSVIQTFDGGYALAGGTYSFGSGDSDFWLVKTDEDGVIIWNRTYGGASLDGAYSVVQTADGGYAIVGTTKSFGAGSWDFWLVKTYSNGTMEWNQTYGGTGYEVARSIVQTADEGYAILGYTWSFGEGDADFWLVKTDMNGSMLWNQTYGTPGYEESWSVIQTDDGGYALAGNTGPYLYGDCDFWLVKTDEYGDMEWNQTCEGTDYDLAFSVIQTNDNGYIISGSDYSSGLSNDFWLIKFASEISWEYVFEDACRHTTLRISTDDGFFQFAAPDKTFAVKQDVDMHICRNMVIICFGDEEMTLFVMANTRIDFCFAIAYDKVAHETYLLVDKRGIE